jgi:hypothetical protein
MNDSLIRKFCESRHRWLIVATGTLLTSVATLLPAVDDYFVKQSSRNGLSEKLAAARETALRLPSLEARVKAIRTELDSLESRAVVDANLADYRSRLVEVVRESGCQIRRIEVSQPALRPWKAGDRPLDDQPNPNGQVTPFSLERRSMVLAVDGTMPAIHELLNKLEEQQTIAHPHRVHLQGISSDGGTVTLELELWLFALSRAAA